MDGCKTCLNYNEDMRILPKVCQECSYYKNYTPRVSSEQKEDLVNHPAHYKTTNGLETIDVIEAFTDGLEGIEATDTGNILKYVCRWKKKNGLQDLKKAQWYLNHLIKKVEEKENK